MQHDIIGNYRVIQKIGAGGMAKVYLAAHVDIPNLKVILKILEDPLLVDRFRQEADKLALLDGNPKICQIKHFFSHGEEFVIAMEYIDGVSLDLRVKQLGHLPLSEAVRITCEVLDVLEFAHAKDIYHRDIKPSNIMIDKRGMVKVIDFGIAKGKSDPDLTTAGTACGTPTYMAPEQFTPTPSTDYRAIDIYAVGTTLFNLATGDLPFKAENEFLLRDAKLFTDPTSPRSLNPEIPKALEDVILKSLKRTPGDRYSSAAAMKTALEAIPLPRTVDTSTEKTVAFKTSGVVQRESKSRIGLIAGVAAAIVVVAAGGYWLFGGNGSTEIDAPAQTSQIDSSGSLSQSTETRNEQQQTGAESTSLVQNANANDTKTERTANQTTTPPKLSVAPVTSDVLKQTEPEPVKTNTVAPAEVRIGSGSYPGAKIFINGKLQSEVTPYAFKLAPGQYRIEIRADVDGRTVSRDTTIVVESGSSARVNLKVDQ